MVRLKRSALVVGVFAIAPSVLWSAGIFGPPKETEVNIVVDLTADGKKVPPPSREHPAYYFPVVAGYREMGSPVAGEKSPPAAPVARLLAKALAAQGYLVMSEKTPPPSLLLVFHWGSLNPQIDDVTSSVPPDDPSRQLPQEIFWNLNEMLGLVAGRSSDKLTAGFERDDLMQAAREDRYFVIVSAFDYQAARDKKKKILWQARMSTPSNQVRLAEVLPAMITSGGPHFGRETDRQTLMAPITREGKVEVGTPTVVDDAARKRDLEMNATEKK